MTQATIDMTGLIVGAFQITEYAPAVGRRAHWWCVCLVCKHQQFERGTNLRKALRGDEYRLVCRECGA